MVFSSIVFLFFFLPLAILLYYAVPKGLRNGLLLLFSLVFYAWGEGQYVLLMLLSIVLNYLFGLGLAAVSDSHRRYVLAAGIVLNLLPLLFYKYAGFIVDNLRVFGGGFLPLPAGTVSLHLPVGISFFTFQSLSYLIDVYRGTTLAQRNIVHLGLYVALFPQLIAGPIVRYRDVAGQILIRNVHIEMFAEGIERFIRGLSKKVLIANPLGKMADIVFSQPVESLSTPVAWLGISSYTLQIYFDFSGYSDMAVGLGKMFGFTFPENFNYPYVSRTLREFWTRWHISLSTWFRDYLYIPLGGNRGSSARTAVNLIAVFFLCGIWHGASWNFVVWGLFHGAFLLLERGRFGIFLNNVPQCISRLYVLLVVMVAWVFFRTETVGQALTFLRKMFDFSFQTGISPELLTHLNNHFLLVFMLALLFSLPVRQALAMAAASGLPFGTGQADGRVVAPLAQGARAGVYLTVLLLAAMNLATGSYNPFIYFRF